MVPVAWFLSLVLELGFLGLAFGLTALGLVALILAALGLVALGLVSLESCGGCGCVGVVLGLGSEAWCWGLALGLKQLSAL
jgi:hypothetical protein